MAAGDSCREMRFKKRIKEFFVRCFKILFVLKRTSNFKIKDNGFTAFIFYRGGDGDRNSDGENSRLITAT